MKKLIIILACFVSIDSLAQDSLLCYTGVVQSSGSSKDELLKNARKWFTTTFKNKNESIQISDKDLGEFSAKGWTRLKVRYKIALGYETRMMDCYYEGKVCVKEGRYKYEFTDIQVREAVGLYRMGKLVTLTSSDEAVNSVGVSGKNFNNALWNSMKLSADDFFKSMVISVKEGMSNKNDKNNF